MSTDVVMKEAGDAKEVEKKESTDKKEPDDKFYGKFAIEKTDKVCVELKKNLILMEKAAKDKDFRTCASLTK